MTTVYSYMSLLISNQNEFNLEPFLIELELLKILR